MLSLTLPTLRNRRLSKREISLICLELLPEGFLMLVPHDWDTAVN
jgi:hypothetical protein